MFSNDAQSVIPPGPNVTCKKKKEAEWKYDKQKTPMVFVTSCQTPTFHMLFYMKCTYSRKKISFGNIDQANQSSHFWPIWSSQIQIDPVQASSVWSGSARPVLSYPAISVWSGPAIPDWSGTAKSSPTRLSQSSSIRSSYFSSIRSCYSRLIWYSQVQSDPVKPVQFDPIQLFQFDPVQLFQTDLVQPSPVRPG